VATIGKIVEAFDAHRLIGLQVFNFLPCIHNCDHWILNRWKDYFIAKQDPFFVTLNSWSNGRRYWTLYKQVVVRRIDEPLISDFQFTHDLLARCPQCP
jgi:hypothetical protein